VPFQLWRVKRMARRDGEHTRQLAEKAQDELDRRKQPGT
jgi:hypothetical protein